MVLWVSVGVLISIALLTVIITLLKNISEENQDYEEVVYLDQLGEIEKDLMKGNLNLSEKEGLVILKSAVHSQRLLNVAEDLYYTPKQMEEIISILKRFFQENQSISVVQFKELLNISRKYAVDLLEYFDRKNITIMEGNYRFPGKIFVSKD